MVTYYRTAQDQVNDLMAFAMFLLFTGFVFGAVKSVTANDSDGVLGRTGDERKRLPGTVPSSSLKGRTTSPEFLPHALRGGGERVPPQYRDLIGWIREPMPGYSLLLPAVVISEKERKIDAVLKQLKEGVEGIQQGENFRAFLVTMSRFHSYSLGNQMLIMLQKPGAIRVAGFNTWKDLGRWVKKGESGIAILAPIMPPKRKTEERAKRKEETAPAEEEKELAEPRPVNFKVVYVFDVSQTEGKPLPEVEVPALTGQANEMLFADILALMKSSGVGVSFESKPGVDPEVKGWYSPGNGIWVRPEESRAQQFKTLLHEVSHYYTEDVFHIPRRDAETIAESAAFTVGAHFGFDSGTRSFPYVALWSRDKKVLEQNLASIRRVAAKMIESLEDVQKKAGKPGW